MAELIAARRYEVRGRVQGVGFRNFTQHVAYKLGVTGWVWNVEDGSVAAVAQGTPDALGQFELALRKGPAWAEVRTVQWKDEPPFTADHFRISHKPR